MVVRRTEGMQHTWMKSLALNCLTLQINLLMYSCHNCIVLSEEDWYCNGTDSDYYVPGYKSVNVSIFCGAEWLFECTVQKLVLVITCLETNEVLERWQFDIECDKSAKENRSDTLPSTLHLSLADD